MDGARYQMLSDASSPTRSNDFNWWEWPVDSQRGTGRTTRQIEALRQNGTLVVLNSASEVYTLRLLHHLGRKDVQLVTYTRIQSNTEWHRSIDFTDLDIDHSVWLELARRGESYESDKLFHTFVELKSRIDARNEKGPD